jgi:hypothetical protein
MNGPGETVNGARFTAARAIKAEGNRGRVRNPLTVKTLRVRRSHSYPGESAEIGEPPDSFRATPIGFGVGIARVVNVRATRSSHPGPSRM